MINLVYDSATIKRHLPKDLQHIKNTIRNKAQLNISKLKIFTKYIIS